MTIALVTGAAGFLGSHLVCLLRSHGVRVRALARVAADAREPGVDWITGDLVDADAMRRATTGANLVFHCAAALPRSGVDELRASNVEGTRTLLGAAIAGGVRRIVYVSTDSVYGDRHHTAASEETPLDPRYYREGTYPRTKLEGEYLLLEADARGLVDATVLRPCLMYGPGRSAGTSILRRWASRRIHVVFDGGAARLSLLYVDDMARALWLAGTVDAAAGRCYNVSSGAYSRREILDALSRVTSTAPPVMSVPSWPFKRLIDRVRFAVTDHVVDTGRARRELGFQSEVALDEGLLRTRRWLVTESDEVVRARSRTPEPG